MNRRIPRVSSTMLWVCALLLMACAPTAPGQPRGDGDSRRSRDGVSRLSVALLVEPADILNKFGVDGGADYQFIFSSSLTRRDAAGNIVPYLAASVPSLDDGTWKANGDGTMETTWRIRSNARWHDGKPLTVRDFIWEWELSSDRDLPVAVRLPNSIITRIDALDDHTMVMHWKQPYILANAIADNVGEPLPQHVLGELYSSDKQRFLNSQYWSAEFIGLGPFRVSEWMAGSYVRGVAFDHFVLGRPRIDEITIKFIPDNNTVLANLLAGDLDISLQNTIRGQQAAIVRERWGPSGAGTVLTLPVKHRYTEVQYRPLFEGRQTPAARDVRVRQALMYGFDRAELTEALLQGFGQVSDMYLNPGDAAFNDADRAIRKYPFDVGTAQRLLADAGWTKGADGMLAGGTGERFTLEVRTTGEEVNEQEVAIMADMWRRNLGIDTNVFVIPQAKQKDDEFRALFPGVSNSATSIGPTWLDKFQSGLAPGPNNRWRGGNRGAYNNPSFDAAYERYVGTLPEAERQRSLVDVIKIASEDLTYLPLYYQVDVHAIRRGLTGPGPRWPGQSGLTWNVHEWYWE